MSGKREHSLHTAADAQDFLRKFTAECGCTVMDCVSGTVEPDRLAAIILIGSIPLGIGTSVSDVDMMVVVDSPDALAGCAGKTSAVRLFSGTYVGDSAGLALASVVLLLNGVEVDLIFVAAASLQAMQDRLEYGGVSLTPHQIRLLSSIKTGWYLNGQDSPSGRQALAAPSNALEVHCAVSYFVSALKDREDAYAALSDNIALSYHLGRECVLRCYDAFLSARGYAYVGNKWLRLLARLRERSMLGGADGDLLNAGVALLFPTWDGTRAEAEHYLERVDRFILAVRRILESDLTFKLALQVCPQVTKASSMPGSL